MEDLIRGLRPDERVRMLVGYVEVDAESSFELAGAAVHATAQMLLGDRGESVLDAVSREALDST